MKEYVARKDINMQAKFQENREQINVDLKATRIFFENMDSDKEINVNVGGGASSKSYSICQLLTYKFLTEKRKKFLVVRKTLPSLRTSVLWLFYSILHEFGVRDRVREDKVGMNLFFGDNVIHFNGLDDPEKIKSSDWNYMWIEEATDIAKDDFNVIRLYLRAQSLDKKKNQIFLSLNPIDEFHWIKDYLLDNPEMSKNVKFIHSTYKDNPFIDETTRQRYEDLITQDYNFYRIYALGEWGKLEDLIYKNWDTVDSYDRNIPGGTVIYGLDFGFNDPNVVTRSVVKGYDAWHEALLYRPNMTNKDLIDFMKANMPKSEWTKPIFADAQNPDKIRELRIAGFNAKPAQKNVYDGIDLMKRMRHHVLASSTDIIKEFRAYSWKKDRNGNITDEPVDFLNHSMDALRYALYSQLRGEGLYKVRWI